MGTTAGEMGELLRRWNAAALQRYLRRGEPLGAGRGPLDFQAVLGELDVEVHGDAEAVDLLQTAWTDLEGMGLLITKRQQDGNMAWRLADAPGEMQLQCS